MEVLLLEHPGTLLLLITLPTTGTMLIVSGQ